MAYKIETLTRREMDTLCWLSSRGYDGGILNAAGIEDDGLTLGAISEPDAWEIWDAIEDDPHAFLACNGSDGLADKLLKFVEGIV